MGLQYNFFDALFIFLKPNEKLALILAEPAIYVVLIQAVN